MHDYLERKRAIGFNGDDVRGVMRKHSSIIRFTGLMCLISTDSVETAIATARDVLRNACSDAKEDKIRIQQRLVDWSGLFSHITGQENQSATMQDVIDAFNQFSNEKKRARKADDIVHLTHCDLHLFAMSYAMNCADKSSG